MAPVMRTSPLRRAPARVDSTTAELRPAGCTVLSALRWTGDGYYESVVLDPDGNQVELTV